MAHVVEEGTFEGFDGAELFFQVWAKAKPRATIIGIHGLGEHVEAYKRLAEGLQDSDYQLAMADLRGHGKSAGKRGIGSIDEYVLDSRLFVKVIQERYENLPFFFLGHSMGGLILTKMLIRNGAMSSRGAILSSPLFGVAVKVPFIKEKSASLLNKILPNLTLDNEIPNNHLTHDAAVVREYDNDHLRHHFITPRLFAEMRASMDYCFLHSDKLELPLLLQQAAQDFVVSQPRAEELFETLKCKDKEKIVYEGFYHEIYNEVGREKPIGDLKNWISRHL